MSGRELPAGWSQAIGSDVFEYITSGSRGWAKYYSEDGALFVRVANLGRERPEMDLSERQYVQPPGGTEGVRTKIRPDDILITITADLGRVAVVPHKFADAYVNQHVALVRSCKAVRSDYIAWYLLSPDGQRNLGTYNRGVTRAGLGLNDIASVDIPFAPFPEQRRIVEKIEALTTHTRRAREALDTLPALIDRYRQSILAAAFRGDLTAEWREKQNDLQPISDAELSGLRRQLWDAVQEEVNAGRKSRYQSAEDIAQEGAELPEGWRWVTVDELCPIVQYGTSAKTTEQDGVVVLRMGNIQSGTIVFDSIKSLPEEHGEFPSLLLDRGDLLFNRTNSPELVGKSAVFDGYSTPCSFASYLIRLKVAGLNPRLLAAYINSPFGRVWARGAVSQQVGQANINGSKLKALAVPLPPAEEQEQILRKLEAHDEMIARVIDQHRFSAARLATLDQSILAKAFRGELVPQDPNDEPASVLLERIRAERAAAGPVPRRGRRPKAVDAG